MTAFVLPANYAFGSYVELVDAINDWLDRSDLSGVAGQMIALAEARIRRALDGYFDETTASVSCDTGTGPLPADYGVVRAVVHDGKVLPQYAQTVGNIAPEGSIPLAWSIEGGRLKLWPAVTTSVTMLYQPVLAPLTDTTPNNDILDRHPDVYFFGAMMFAEGYVANDARAGLFKSLFDEALAEAKGYITRQRFGGPLVPRLGAP